MATDLNGTIDDGEFNTINEFDKRQEGPPRIGDIYDIDIFGPDNGSVVLTDMGDNYFIFATISTLETGTHPEYGAREFGFETNDDGSFTFYTSGVSRPGSLGADLFGDLPQEIGWTNLVEGIGNTLEAEGADVRGVDPSERHELPPSQVEDLPEMLEQLQVERALPSERYFYRIVFASNNDLDQGIQETSGITDRSGNFDVDLPDNVNYKAYLYNPSTNLYGSTGGETGVGGVQDTIGTIHVTSPDYADADGDGLGDIAEFVVGTSSGTTDTDGDGVLDFAEVKRGSDPLDPERHEPPTSPGVRADALTTHGEQEVNVTFVSEEAAFSNALGFFVLDDGGDFVDAGIVLPDTNDPGLGARPPTSIGSFPDGTQVGFFLIQNGADAIEELTGFFSGDAEILSTDGDAANVNDLVPPQVILSSIDIVERPFPDPFLGPLLEELDITPPFVPSVSLEFFSEAVDAPVFFTFDPTPSSRRTNELNDGGFVQTTSGFAPDGAIRIGFEDLVLAESDRDFNDLVVDVTFTDVGSRNDVLI